MCLAFDSKQILVGRLSEALCGRNPPLKGLTPRGSVSISKAPGIIPSTFLELQIETTIVLLHIKRVEEQLFPRFVAAFEY